MCRTDRHEDRPGSGYELRNSRGHFVVALRQKLLEQRRQRRLVGAHLEQSRQSLAIAAAPGAQHRFEVVAKLATLEQRDRLRQRGKLKVRE